MGPPPPGPDSRSPVGHPPSSTKPRTIPESPDLLPAARALLADRKGVTALEYGLIAALIAVVIIGGVTAVGTNAAAVFTGIATKLARRPKPRPRLADGASCAVGHAGAHPMLSQPPVAIPALLAAALHDVVARTIPNRLSLGIALLGTACT